MTVSKKIVKTFAKEESLSSYEFWKELNKIRKSECSKPVEHGKFLARVKDEIDDLSHSTILRVEKSNREIEVFQLNRDQMFLIGMRESKVVRKQVLKWLKDLSAKVEELTAEIKAFKIERANASLNYVTQGAMIKHTREAEGKDCKFWHFSNEADLLNRIVLGETAKQHRERHGFDKTVNLRDTLTPIQLECLSVLEVNNTAFISAGLDFDMRKELLNKILDRDFTQRLIDEHMRLEA